MDKLKKFARAFWTNENDVRKHTLIAVGTVAGAIFAGVALTKLNDDTATVIVIEESHPDESSDATTPQE